jgi:hypothetical protein
MKLSAESTQCFPNLLFAAQTLWYENKRNTWRLPRQIKQIYQNLNTAALVYDSLKRKEGQIE